MPLSFSYTENVRRILGVIFTIFAVITVTELLILLFYKTFSFHSCELGKKLDKNAVGCAGYEGSFPFDGAFFILPVEKISQEADETILTLKYPILGGILSLPLRVRVGVKINKAFIDNSNKNPTLALCKNSQGFTCSYMPAQDLLRVVKPRMIVGIKVFSQNLLQNEDSYFINCQNVQKNFVSSIKIYGSVLSYLNTSSGCLPIVGQITTP